MNCATCGAENREGRKLSKSVGVARAVDHTTMGVNQIEGVEAIADGQQQGED